MRDCGNFIERGIIQRSPLLFNETKMICKGFFYAIPHLGAKSLTRGRLAESILRGYPTLGLDIDRCIKRKILTVM